MAVLKQNKKKRAKDSGSPAHIGQNKEKQLLSQHGVRETHRSDDQNTCHTFCNLSCSTRRSDDPNTCQTFFKLKKTFGRSSRVVASACLAIEVEKRLAGVRVVASACLSHTPRLGRAILCFGRYEPDSPSRERVNPGPPCSAPGPPASRTQIRQDLRHRCRSQSLRLLRQGWTSLKEMSGRATRFLAPSESLLCVVRTGGRERHEYYHLRT